MNKKNIAKIILVVILLTALIFQISATSQDDYGLLLISNGLLWFYILIDIYIIQ